MQPCRLPGILTAFTDARSHLRTALSWTRSSCSSSISLAFCCSWRSPGQWKREELGDDSSIVKLSFYIPFSKRFPRVTLLQQNEIFYVLILKLCVWPSTLNQTVIFHGLVHSGRNVPSRFISSLNKRLIRPHVSDRYGPPLCQVLTPLHSSKPSLLTSFCAPKSKVS